MKRKTRKEIDQAIKRAYDKHGPMKKDKGYQLAVLQEELGEASEAFLDGKANNYRMEILDLVAASIRVLERVT